MKAIILGSNGYIGKHLAFYLKKQGLKLLLCDIQLENQSSVDAPYCQIDITKVETIQKINFEVDLLFFMSGITGTSQAYKNPDLFVDVNEKGLLNVLNHLTTISQKPKFIFPSTRLVYKGKKDFSLTENEEKECKTIYAANKLSGEHFVMQYGNYFNVKYAIFRICVPYGNIFDKNYSYGTVGFFLKKAHANEAITLFGNGELKRTFTHVEDICYQMYYAALLRESDNQIYNIKGETFSLLDAAKIIAEKYNGNIQFVNWPELELKMESGDTVFNSAKIEQLLGYDLKNYLVDCI